jgi:hypothetical protein
MVLRDNDGDPLKRRVRFREPGSLEHDLVAKLLELNEGPSGRPNCDLRVGTQALPNVSEMTIEILGEETGDDTAVLLIDECTCPLRALAAAIGLHFIDHGIRNGGTGIQLVNLRRCEGDAKQLLAWG